MAVVVSGTGVAGGGIGVVADEVWGAGWVQPLTNKRSRTRKRQEQNARLMNGWWGMMGNKGWEVMLPGRSRIVAANCIPRPYNPVF